MTAAGNDPSTRFVAPADSPLPANLAALWTLDANLAKCVEGAQAGSCRVERSRNGEPTLAYVAAGRSVQLHSRYDPTEEARKLADSVDTTEKLLLFVHGLGLGYHVEELFKRAGAEAILFVFEPRIDVIRAAVETRRLSEVLASNRIAIVSDADKAGLFSRLMPHASLASIGVATLKHAPSIQIAPREHAEFEQLTADFLAYARTCVSTLVVNGKRTVENIIRNLPWYVANPGLSRSTGAYAGEPAIIVSAGPSLRKNMHLVRQACGEAVIIAVQTTLQPLLEIGVQPQFVTSLDYHDICTRFFEKLPQNLKTELIAEPKATDAVFDLMPGPVSLLGNDLADTLLSEMMLNRPRLPAGATVAHLAFYLAEHLGCDPIIFIGQDLGFSDGLCYAPGTSYEDVWRPELGPFCTLEMKQWEQIVRDRGILRRVMDHAGRPTYTEERLFTYLQHFERDFARCTSRVIDATEGGVLKRGAESMTFADALARFCRGPLRGSPRAHPGISLDRLDEAAMCLRRRRDDAGRIESISSQTLPLLSEIRDHIDDQPRVNRAIARIDRLRAQVDGLGSTYHLITQLTQQSEMKRFVSDRRIAAAEVDATEKQRRQVMRDIENVAAIESAAKELQSLLDDAIASMHEFAARRQRRAA